MNWPSIKNSHFLFTGMTVRTCFSCTTISVYGIMSKNCAPELLANPRWGRVFSFAGAKVQQFRKPTKHITLFFEKKCMNTITYIIEFICRGTPARKGKILWGSAERRKGSRMVPLLPPHRIIR